MLSTPFNRLLTGTLSSTMVRWKSSLCPCVQSDGSADQSCGVCGGLGRFYGAPSAVFRAGFIGQDSQSLKAIMQRMGPGEVGEAVLVLPSTAPCYADIRGGDRIAVTDLTDEVDWAVTPSQPVTLPFSFVAGSAYVRTPDGAATTPVAFPTPDANGRVVVAVPTVLRFSIPRRYEVVRELPRVRTFGAGLPKRLSLKRIDETVR